MNIPDFSPVKGLWNRTYNILKNHVSEVTPAVVAELDPDVPIKGFGQSCISNVALWLEENGIPKAVTDKWWGASLHHYDKLQNKWKADKRKLLRAAAKAKQG